MTELAHDHHAHDAHVGHVVPIRLTLGVGTFLLIMTVITVFTAKFVDLGSFNIWLALLIAFVKASAVCLYFMHLRWDSPFNGIVLIASFLFVILFIGLAITDTAEYRPQIDQWRRSGLTLPE